MDSPFKSSFIPKQALSEAPRRRPRTIGFFTLLVIIAFLTSVGIAAGVFFYKSYLKKNIADMQESLAEARATFDLTRIDELQRLDTRIKEAKVRLDTHTAPTLLFDLLQTNTLKNVRYDNFEYEADPGEMIHVKIGGEAKNFSAVALQSDTFGANENVLNPIFDDLNPDGEGFVGFIVDAFISPDFMSYGNSLGFGTIETSQPVGDVFKENTTLPDVGAATGTSLDSR